MSLFRRRKPKPPAPLPPALEQVCAATEATIRDATARVDALLARLRAQVAEQESKEGAP